MFVLLMPHAKKDLAKLQPNEREKAIRKLDALEKEPYSGKKLTGEFKDLYSLRSWPYRILYQIDKPNKLVKVTKVSHRQSAY